LFPETFPSTRENGEQNRRNREEEEEGNARAKKWGGGSAKTAVFFRALRVLGFLIRSARVFLYLGAAQKQKLKYSKENFCDHRFKTKRRPKERKTKGEEFFSNFSASSSSLFHRPRASFHPHL